MAKKQKNTENGFVYSTDPDFELGQENEITETLAPEKQKLQVFTEKIKGNKLLTVVTGFVGTDEDLEKLGKLLKNKCATGGSAKDGEILIQGDFKQKVADFLKSQKYQVKIK